MTESMAEVGVYGQTAETIARNARAGQQQALRANIPAIQERIAAGGSRVGSIGEGGQAAQDALVRPRQADRAGVNASYGVIPASPA